MKVKKDYIWYGVTAFLVALVVVAWVNPVHFGEISPAKAGEIVKNLYSSVYQGMDFKVVNVTSLNGIYEVTLSVSYNGQTQLVRSGITKDGKYFMPTVISVEELQKKITNNSNTESQTTKFEPNKTQVPDVKLFVMPFCPFGQPAENAMYSVAKLLGNKINYRVHYIIDVRTSSEWNSYLNQIKNYLEQRGINETQIDQYLSKMNSSALVLEVNGTKYYISSLHGKNEAMEAIRQLCIWKYYPDKAIDYIWGINHNCSLSDINTCWSNVASNLGIDVTKIENCYNTEGVQLAMKEEQIDKQYGVTASPTLIINGVVWNGDRTSNAYKEAICESFTNVPQVCSETINETGSAPTGSCG